MMEALKDRRPIILAGPTSKIPVSCLVCVKKDNLYELVCKHLICKTCLNAQVQKSSEILCTICTKTCPKSDVVKFHSVSLT